jgi:hypothetical protein
MNRLAFKKNLDKSGKMYRENYLENNFPEILVDIKEFTNKYNLYNIDFKQQVYHWFNNIKDIQKCYCGNDLKFKNSTIGYFKYCSKECMDKSDVVKNKRINTNLEKFGTKTPSENNKIKNKIIKTNNEKYGNNSPLQNDKIIEKSKITLKNNYNVDNPLKNNEIKQKIKITNLNRYGVDNPLKSDKIREKIKNTIYEKYGVYHALQNEQIKNKSINKQLLTISNKIKEYYNEYNILEIDNTNKKYKMMCDKKHIFDIDYSLLNSRRKTNTIICTICNPIDKSISGLEIELINFIKENYNDNIIFNDRHLGKELDIYIPDLKLAFEFNGLYWHSEINKPINYHLDKTKLCEKNKIQLIHIWEDDWIYKKDIIKSMVINKLGKTSNKIYARKCEIKEIDDNKLVRNFLDDNHIQGFAGSNIKIGLFYNNELVSLMTFGKKRLITNNKNIDNEWELIRFVNKKNTSVIGGANKLFKYFIKKYNPKNIITYANRSYSNGNLYNKLNFKFLHYSKPNYYYIINKIRKHRFSYRKSKLKLLKNYDINLTEHEIMLKNNIYKIYDSGNMKFIFE